MRRLENPEGLFTAFKTNKVSDEVYDQIVALIASGKLKPGEKIPSERQISSELGVSRQSIREAIHRAVVVGLIEVRQGEGTFIRSSIFDPLKPPLTVIVETQAERVFEFLELRKLIEGWCAEKAARDATSQDMDRMREILARMKEIPSKDSRWEELDVKFHFSIAEATHNVIAIHLMQALKDNFGTFFRFRSSITSSEKMDVLWQHHHDIFEAIQKRNGAAAKQKIARHLDFIGEKIREDMEKMNT